MLVTHAYLSLQLAETAAVLQKGRSGVLADVAVVVIQNALVVDIGIRMVGISIFPAERQVSVPQGTADDKLGSIERVLVLVVAGDVLLLQGFAGGGIFFGHILQRLAV